MKNDQPIGYHSDYFHEMEGYKASIHIDKIADSFNMCHWQSGDPLGWMKIEGNGVSLKFDKVEGAFGADKDKLNLTKGRDLVVKFGYKLKEKYNTEPDYSALHKLFEPVFQHFYDDFYNNGVKTSTKLPKGFGSGGRRY
jgi:hypothetical protein